MKHFRGSIILSIVCLALAFYWGGQHAITYMGGESWTSPVVLKAGLQALFITAILSVMEVSLSFDNAVVNAAILKTWNAFWKKLFLTVGMVIAVFGMRLVFPILIVAVATGKGMIEVGKMALNQPTEYAARLTEHHQEVAVFGGVFLLLVFLNFLIDEGKDVHWFRWFEERLAILGKIDVLSVFIAILAVFGTLSLVDDPSRRYAILASGIGGIATYLGVDILGKFFEHEESDPAIAKMIQGGSIGSFLYLEVLDASFSFDGVIGAFAMTNDVIVIMLGLGIGAMFVRSLTIYLLEKGTLEQYIFLEHGAHYAIGALALIMLASMKWHIPEVVTGVIGVAFIIISIISSIRYRKTNDLS
ncbi:MAG: DUF475 domain-containing protein [Pseudomonadota bacterium]